MNDKNISLEEEVYIGARVLADEDIKALLPTYENIFKQIEDFRKKAEIIKLNKKENLNNETRECTNVISILGGRGTGKTSVMLTAKNRIEKSCKETVGGKEIILPLIVPDNMGENSDTLGWIITHLSEKIKKIKKEYIEFLQKNRGKCEINDDFKKYCIKEEPITLINEFKELQKSYYFRKPMYYQIMNKDFLGKNEYIGDAKEALEVDQKLIENFQKCIQELLEIQRQLNDGKEPLIYLFFDDVDISAKRGMEVLISVMKYLKHPNIVVFLSGDYNVFLEVVTLEFLKSENLLDNNLMEKNFILDTLDSNLVNTNENNTNALELRKTRSYDFLKKIMPPAFRYEMPLLSDKQKSEFRYSKKSSEKDILGESLVELLKKNFKIEGEKLFLFESEDNIIYDYFKIFDNTPRGLINVYYYLWEMKEKMNGVNEDIKNHWQVTEIKQFLDIIVNSSLELEKYKNIIYNIIKIKNFNNKMEYYIDYNYLENLFKESIEVTLSETNSEESHLYKRINLINSFMKIFILAHFFENILKNINAVSEKKDDKKTSSNSSSTNIHGHNVILTILNSVNSKYKLYPKLNDVNKILNLHYKLSSKISDINLAKIFTGNSKEDRYIVALYFEQLSSWNKEINSLSNTFEFIYSIDREWVKKNINQLFKYSNFKNEILNSSKQYFSKYIVHGINMNIVQNEDFNKYIKDENITNSEMLDIIITKFEKNDSKDYQYHKDIMDNAIEFFLKSAEEKKVENTIYKLKYELKDENIRLEINKQSLNTIQNQFKNNNIKDIIEKMDNIEERKSELNSYLENEFNKNIWNSFKNNIIYKSFDEIDNEELDSEIIFSPKEIINKYLKINLDFSKGNLKIKNEDGLLPNTKELLEKYFKKLEEYKLLNKYSGYNIKDILANEEDIKHNLENIQYELNKHEKNLDELHKQINKIKMNLENWNEIDVNGLNEFKKYLIHQIKEQVYNYDFSVTEEDNYTKGEKILNLFENIMDNELKLINRSINGNNMIQLDTSLIKALVYFKDLRLTPNIDRRVNSILENNGYVDFTTYKQLVAIIEREVINSDINTKIRSERLRNSIFVNKGFIEDKLNILNNFKYLDSFKSIDIRLNTKNNIIKFISIERIKILLYYCIMLKTLLEDLKSEQQQATATIKNIWNTLIKDKNYENLPSYNGFKKYVEDKMNCLSEEF